MAKGRYRVRIKNKLNDCPIAFSTKYIQGIQVTRFLMFVCKARTMIQSIAFLCHDQTYATRGPAIIFFGLIVILAMQFS